MGGRETGSLARTGNRRKTRTSVWMEPSASEEEVGQVRGVGTSDKINKEEETSKWFRTKEKGPPRLPKL